MAEIKLHKVARADERKLPIFGEIDRMMQRIRERAFLNFAERDIGDARELKDWQAAERELGWPVAELVEHDQHFVLSVAIAGFQPRDITVTATPRELIVKATAQKASGDNERSSGGRVCWSEFRRDDVYRRVELPVDIQVGKVSANYEHGLLTIVAPKQIKATGKPVRKSAAGAAGRPAVKRRAEQAKQE